MQVKKQQLEVDIKQQTGSKWGKKYVKAVYSYPAYLTFMYSTSCEMPGWMKHKLESRLPGGISITSDMQITPSLWQKVNSLLMKAKKESEKPGLKVNIQKTSIKASSPITSWQVNGETMETEVDFIFLGSNSPRMVTEIKRHLLLGSKAVTNLDSVLKSRECLCSNGLR